MSHGYQTIVVVSDGTQNSAVAEQTGCELALRHGAQVFIIDTLRPPTFFSKWLSNYEEIFESLVADKQQRLDKIAVRFEASGITVESDVLIGKSSDEIVRFATEKNADLVVRYMKGFKSQRASAFGATALNLAVVCPCPLLLVGSQPFAAPTVLAAINCELDDADNTPILCEANRLSGADKKPLAIYCWKFYGGEFLKDYVDDATLAVYEAEAEKNYQSLYQRFIENHDLVGIGEVLFENGDPIERIPQVCRERNVDVVVMCHSSHHWLQVSTFESVIEELACSVLVVKPNSSHAEPSTDDPEPLTPAN